MSIKRWVMPAPDKDTAAQLAEECEIHPFLALMLVTRGITDAQSAADFLIGTEISDDPFAFADMDVAVNRIQRALDLHEQMAVYGDYDADGITATVLLYTYLREKGGDVSYYLPDREKEGYGLHIESIDTLHQQGVRLIITVDNGVAAVAEIDHANALGMDVVVTDHHQPPAVLPRALAVVNPHRADCGSQFKDYAGVGVAFKLACALEGDTDTVLDQVGDLVTIGTIGDVMPLRGENRALVRQGLRLLNDSQRPGVRQLRKVAGVESRILTSVTTAFSLVPRINAAGRMDSPDVAARLLLTTQDVVAQTLAGQIQECNVARQKAEGAILEEILSRLQEQPEALAQRVLVIDGEDWHAGVIGILASRLVDRYGKPCILISRSGSEAKGSGRSIKGFSLYEAVSACSSFLTHFGGHEMAAGVSLTAENIPLFRAAINDFAAQQYPVMPVPELVVDFKLRPSQVDVEKLSLLSALEPFGTDNPSPVFGLFHMRLDNIMPMGQGKHLRLSVSRDEVSLSVVRFNTTIEAFPYECGQIVNLIVSLERNEYRGVVTPSVLLKDIRSADVQQDELIRAGQDFDMVMRGQPLTPEQAAAWCPGRAQLEQTYRFLRGRKGWRGPLEQLRYFIHETISYQQLRICLEVLRQAGLVSIKDGGMELCVTVLPVTEKTDLTHTPLWNYFELQQQK